MLQRLFFYRLKLTDFTSKMNFTCLLITYQFPEKTGNAKFYFYRMEYLALHLNVSPREPFAEMLTYHLSEAGFEMFEETPEGLTAYIPSAQFDENSLQEMVSNISALGCEIVSKTEQIAPKNWNEEWESNFQPQIIGDLIYVRADFHAPDPSYKYEIVVQPKMAFGTGHHATTSQVMEQMLQLDFKGKAVLDMGSGTGILAILAGMLGATEICAIDIDSVCAESSAENSIRNGYPGIEVLQGVAADLQGRTFAVILANINRNIILSDLPFYATMLLSGGTIIMSGFYFQDLAVIREQAAPLQLEYLHHTVKNEWCCAIFRKA